MPWRFHGCSSGWILPAASVARQARRCSPGVACHVARPRTPGERAERIEERGVLPGAVDAELDARDRRHAGPGAAVDDRPAPARRSAGASGSRGSRAGSSVRAGASVSPACPGSSGPRPVAVGDGLLIAVERRRDGIDARQPLDLRHAVPAGNQQAERETVLRLERPPVHLVGEEHVRRASRRRSSRLRA